MIKQAIADTGPLVAFLDRDEKHHAWTVEQVKSLRAPLLVCEAVLTEALFLLARAPKAQSALLGLLEHGALKLGFSLADNVSEIRLLFGKYGDRPISLADACLIRMTELNPRHFVFTLDSDFQIYRKHGREPLKVISPHNT